MDTFRTSANDNAPTEDKSASVKHVYIFDQRNATETHALHKMWRACTRVKQSDFAMVAYATLHELIPQETVPLGTYIAEAISIDDKAIRELIASDKDWWLNSELNFPTISDCFKPCKPDEYLYVLNRIAELREFIDLCNVNPFMSDSIWFDAFVETAKLHDYVLVYDGIVGGGNVVIGNGKLTRVTWEERPETALQDILDIWDSCDVDDEGDKLDALSHDLEGFRRGLFRYVGIEEEENKRFQNNLHMWEVSDILHLFVMSLSNCRDNNVKFAKCKNCGMYFVPQKRSDTLYCDRQAPQDNSKTCKEYGARQTWQQTLKENEAAGLYRKIYMSKQMLAKRNPDLPDYQLSFEKYKALSKQWKSDVKSGRKTESEYIEWLKSVKEKKVL